MSKKIDLRGWKKERNKMKFGRILTASSMRYLLDIIKKHELRIRELEKKR